MKPTEIRSQKSEIRSQPSSATVPVVVRTGRHFRSALWLTAGLCSLTSVAHAADLPDPNHYASIGWVIVILLGLAVAVASVASAVSTIRYNNRPQPSFNDQLSNVQAGLNNQLDLMRREAKEGRAKIHNHVDQVKHEIRDSLAAIETDLRDHDRKIVALETKIWGNN